MGVATTIEARIKAASSTASIVEATELLLGLGRAPKEMWTAMIQAEAKHLGQVKTACLQAMVGLKERAKKDGTSSTAPDGSEDTQIVLAVDLVNERYLADLARFATGFEELFLQPAGGTVAAGPTATSITAKPSTSVAPSANTSPTEALPATTRSGTSSSTLPRTRTDRILPTLTPEERNEARQALRTALTGPISDYFAMVSDTLGSPLDIFELDTINFGVVLGAVQRAAALYPSLCRHGELDDEARRFCFTRVRRTVNSLFTRANRDALDRFIPLWTVDPASPPDLAKFVGEAVSYLDFLLNTKVFTVVSSIFSPPNSTGFADGFPDGRVEFLEIVRVELRLFWLDLLQGLLHYSSPHYFQGDGPRHPSVKHTDPPPAVVTLAMVRYCIDLPVRAIYETFAGLWGRKKDATQPDSWSKVRRVVTDGNAGEEVMLDAKDVAESAETKCGELAALYAANAADQVSAPLAGYLGWRSEWTGARPAVESCSDAVVETIRLVSQQDREIAQFFPDPERSKSGAPSPYLAGPSRSTASLGFAGRGLASSPSLVGRPNIPPIRTDRALLSNIDKLFAEEEEWYTPTFKPGHRTLVSTVVKLALKNWVELVRRQTFGKDGFQQLQTDAEIARFGLWKYNWNERGYNSLVDEIIGSAAARSVQVEYVDSVKLGKLVTAFESQGVGAMRG